MILKGLQKVYPNVNDDNDDLIEPYDSAFFAHAAPNKERHNFLACKPLDSTKETVKKHNR
jgi:hypothetical protein